MSRKKTSGSSFETVREIGRSMDGVEESTSYGTPALKAKGKLMARLKEDGESLVLVIGFDPREILLAAKPDVFYITEHYRNYPMVLVHLARIEREELRDLLETARGFVLAKKRVPRRRTK